MSHLPNWQEAEQVGQDKQYKDFTEMHDAGHGCHKDPVIGTTTKPEPKELPLTPSPFTVEKK